MKDMVMDRSSQLSVLSRILLRTVVLIPVLVGLGVLLLWVAGKPEWAALGEGRVPMALSTALLFCLFGLAICLSICGPGHQRINRAALWFILLGAVAALVLGILSVLGIRLGAEHLGIDVRNPISGVPSGHISPVSAAAFVLAAISFLATPTANATRFRNGMLALVFASLVLTLSLGLLLSYLFGVPVLYGTSFIPPALLTCLMFLVLGIALFFRALPHLKLLQGRPESEIRAGLYYLWAFALFGGAILTASFIYFRKFESDYRVDIERQLSAIAELKVYQLVEYRRERLADAFILANTPGFSDLVSRALRGPAGSQANRELQSWMDQLKSLEHYERVWLLDDRIRMVKSAPEQETPLDAEITQGVSQVLRSGEVRFQDFYLSNQDHQPHLALLVPILDTPLSNRVNGVLVLRIDPRDFLYPFLKKWPVPSETAETLLVRREGDEVLFLNDLKFAKDAPLRLRFPLTRTDLPAAKALLSQKGVVEGRDYRGMPVYAGLCPVPESPWYLVARMDLSEALAPVRDRVWQLLGLNLTLMLAAAWGFGFLWRQQRIRSLKANFRAEQERAWLHDVIARSLNEIYVFDVRTLHFRFVNDGAQRNLGYSMEELALMTPLDIKPEYTETTFLDAVRPLSDGSRATLEFETIHLRKDGSTYPVEVHLQIVEMPHGTVFLAIINDISERVRAQSALAQSRVLLQSIINSTPDPIYVKDSQGRYLLFNAAAEKVVGKRSAEVLGQDDHALFPPGEAARVIEGDRKIMEEGAIKTYEERVSDAEGRSIDFLSTKGPLHDESGALLGMFGISRDITERKRAEEALRKAEEKFRRTFELMPHPVTLQTMAGVLLEGSDAFCESVGYSRGEVLGRTTLELGSWRDVEQRKAMREILRREGHVDGFEIQFWRRDGEMRIMQLSARILTFDPEPIVLTMAQDITERKHAEEALRHSEQKFRTFFENLAEGVALHELVKDEAGKVVDYRLLDVNPAFQLHTGLDAAGALGHLATEIYGTEVPPYLEEYSAVALGGEPCAFETFFPPLEKHFRISVISPWHGQFATVFEDITERKHREEELKQKNAEMERFTYMISHDLKSPLVTVQTFLGYLEQDLEKENAERAAKDMGFIRNATDKMGRLLEDLLEVSRIGRVVNPPTRMNSIDLIQESLASVAGAISSRGVAVQVLGPSVGLFGDRPRLEDLWQNLIENAVKYMGDQPSPKIDLGAEQTGNETVFFVRDNGMGIDPKFQAKIFDLFEKLDSASEGTGLGLALAKRIVELYEGRIWVESEGPGQGTCFRFTLPLALRNQGKGAVRE